MRAMATTMSVMGVSSSICMLSTRSMCGVGGRHPNAIKISVLKNTREEMPAAGGHFHTARLIDMKI